MRSLAIAFDIPETLKELKLEPNQDLVLNLLRSAAGASWGTVKNIKGEFYTKERAVDLRNLCGTILTEREHLRNE
jgi:hypothetical protein